MRIIASYNIKGGVGKTSTAVNLAYLSARDGARTLVWDLDPQAAATYLFRIRPRVKGGSRALIRGRRPAQEAIKGTDFDNLDLLPADFTYRNMDLTLDATKRSGQRLARLLDTLADEYDTVLLDCPPSVSLVSENVVHAADTLLVPLVPTTLSLRAFDQLTDFVAGLPGRPPALLAFFSMTDRRKNLHRQLLVDLPAQRPGISTVSIPAASLVEQMGLHRAPVPFFAPRSPISRAYEQLWQQVDAQVPGVLPRWAGAG
jgi:chromosome partitioning protein